MSMVSKTGAGYVSTRGAHYVRNRTVEKHRPLAHSRRRRKNQEFLNMCSKVSRICLKPQPHSSKSASRHASNCIILGARDITPYVNTSETSPLWAISFRTEHCHFFC